MSAGSAYGDAEAESSSPQLLLRMDLMQRGDVILTRGSEKESKLIAKFSSGLYSHAAFYLHDFTTFESDGGVVGYRFIPKAGFGNINGRKTPLGLLPGNPQLCAVYRQPSLASITEQRFDELLGDQMQASYGTDYSELYRLVRLAKLPVQLGTLLALAVKLFESWGEYNRVPGPFCSELVAIFFSRLQLSLFDDGRIPEKVTPSDLANSKLVLVPGAVLKAGDVQIIEYPAASEHEIHSSSLNLATSIRNLRLARRRHDRQVERGEIRVLSPEQSFEEKRAVAYFATNNVIEQASVVFEIAKEAKNGEQYELKKYASRLCTRFIEIASGASKEISEATTQEELLPIYERVIEFHASLLRVGALIRSRQLKKAMKSGKGYDFILRPFRARERRKTACETRRVVAKYLR